MHAVILDRLHNLRVLTIDCAIVDVYASSSNDVQHAICSF